MVSPAQQLQTAKNLYKLVYLGVFAIIIFVFLEPTYHRLFDGNWQRGNFPYVWTFSLDLHAVLGYSFLSLFLAQLFLGYRLTKNPGSKPAHRILGRCLLYAVIPVFAVFSAWLIYERSTTIPREQAVIFRQYIEMAFVVLSELLLFFVAFSIRAGWAIRRGDVLTHIDSILMAFMMAAGIAIIRMWYFLFWTFSGAAPFSIIGMFFVTMATILILLILVFSLVGRLRENVKALSLLAVVTVLIAVLGAPYYEFLDVT